MYYDAFDLIKRQQIEIENLKEENRIYKEVNQMIAYQRDMRDEEISELYEQINDLNGGINNE